MSKAINQFDNFANSNKRDLKPALYEIQEKHRALAHLSDRDLETIANAIVPSRSLLVEGHSYIDLKRLGKGEFTAMPGERTGEDSWIAAKHLLPNSIWYVLLGAARHELTEDESVPRG